MVATDLGDPVDLVGGQALGASEARIFDCLLGGKDHYQQDEQAADAFRRASPGLVGSLRGARRFTARAVRHLTADHGIHQFLDVGCGIPSNLDLYSVVQQADPAATVVCVDNDPSVTARARALHRSAGPGVSECAEADLRRPDRLLAAPEVARTIDVTRPVAVSLLAVLHVVAEGTESRQVVAELLAPFPSGSALVITTLCGDGVPGEAATMERLGRRYGMAVHYRSQRAIADLFAGLDVERPGVVPVHLWRAGVGEHGPRNHRMIMVGGVGIKR